MDFESAAQELYRIVPAQFTTSRDKLVAQARQAGQSDFASSLKKIRKPSVGAWLANLLAHEQASEVQNLIELGRELRAPNRRLDGEQIRRVSKEKNDVVSKLVRDAKSKAQQAGQKVSPAASEELEATLEAAFADSQAAERLLAGRLSTGLHYSGLGFEERISTGERISASDAATKLGRKSDSDLAAAERSLKKANDDADRADAELVKAKVAKAEAAKELTRLKSAEALATRESKAAHARVLAAKRRVSQLR
jgi:hypothetical protein